MKPVTFIEARVLAAMARGGTLARKPSKTFNPLHYPWELRDGGGGIIYYPAKYRRDNRQKEGDCPLWWAKKLAPLVERGLLIADHPTFIRAARLYITDEGKALAWRLQRSGNYGEPIPCLICDHSPHEATDHEYQPARKWARDRSGE